MERLGLWGEGATFKSFEEFIDIVQRKGLGESFSCLLGFNSNTPLSVFVTFLDQICTKYRI